MSNVSENLRPCGANGPDPDKSRDMSRRVWSCCVYFTTAVGLLCVILEWGWRGAVTTAVCVAGLAAAFAVVGCAGDGLRAVPRIARLGLVTGLVVPAIAGLVAVCGMTGLLIVLVLAGTTPALTSLVQARWLAPGGLPGAARPAATTVFFPGSLDEIALNGRTAELARDLSSLDNDALCLAWRRSFLLLEAAHSAVDRLSIVEQRQKYLDELHRRSPQGLAAWLASGARASGNPLPYVSDRWRRAG
jgi:hypothetical protein